MDSIIVPTKSDDIGMRQLRCLANLYRRQQWTVLADGLPLILKSAEELYSASQEMKHSGRVREILEGHAEEEAAKILSRDRKIEDVTNLRPRNVLRHRCGLTLAQITC